MCGFPREGDPTIILPPQLLTLQGYYDSWIKRVKIFGGCGINIPDSLSESNLLPEEQRVLRVMVREKRSTFEESLIDVLRANGVQNANLGFDEQALKRANGRIPIMNWVKINTKP